MQNPEYLFSRVFFIYYTHFNPRSMKYLVALLSSLFLLTACTSTSTSTSTVSKDITPPTIGQWGHTVDLYIDYQCPACINFSKTLGPILEKYAENGQLKVTYKQYPLTRIHQNAYRDALAAMCAHNAGKYMDFKKAMYALEEEKAGAKVSDDDRTSVAKWVGIDEAAFKVCLSEEHYKARVDGDMKDGDAAGIRGTPTVILDGKILDLSLFRNESMFQTFMDRYLGITSSTSTGSQTSTGAVESGSGK